MKEPKVLDSYALLAYLKKEDDYEKVKSILSAEYFTSTILPSLPITQRANTFQDVLGVARIKAIHPLSYADCFAIHTAIKEVAILVTGDPEFKKAENIVKIDWL